MISLIAASAAGLSAKLVQAAEPPGSIIPLPPPTRSDILDAAQTADVPEASAAAAAVFAAPAVQGHLDSFTQAIIEDDADAFAALVSREVLTRTAQRGYTLPKLLAKQRKAIARTFRLAEGVLPKPEVDEVLVQGDVARVTLRFRGEELKKPFYFVREDGELKLNIAPPGFSRPVPQGAQFGKDSYRVHNVNIFGNPSFGMQCYQGSDRYMSFSVPANSTRQVSCENTCGWFSGSTFADLAVVRVRKCDWNWWGDDVIINQLDVGGWHCNDNC